MTAILGFLKSWKVWASLGGVIVILVAGWYVLHLASSVGELRSELDRKQEQVEQITADMQAEQQQHETELAARDAGMMAKDAAIEDAKNRASALSQQLSKARQADATLDACLSHDLPDAVLERLPK